MSDFKVGQIIKITITPTSRVYIARITGLSDRIIYWEKIKPIKFDSRYINKLGFSRIKNSTHKIEILNSKVAQVLYEE